jgi:hypothetical protein
MGIANPVTGTTITAAWGTQVATALNAINLPIKPGEAIAPLSGVQAAALDIAESSGAGTAKPVIYRMLFDKTTDEGRMWIFRVPDTYVSAPVLKIQYYMTGANTTKKINWNCQVACVSDGDASMTAKVFAATNAADVTVPDAAGTLDVATITLTNADSMAAGDWCCLLLWDDASGGTVGQDVAVVGAVMTYSLA